MHPVSIYPDLASSTSTTERSSRQEHPSPRGVLSSPDHKRTSGPLFPSRDPRTLRDGPMGLKRALGAPNL
jgi:hypothetical protein